MRKFHFRFPEKRIEYWADRYEYTEEAVEQLTPAIQRRGYLTEEEFLTVCRWKTPRSQPRCRTNSPEFIHEVTKCALGTPDERLRIEVLTLLNGVRWPTASVILHFFHQDPYPILDFRALWSLGFDAPDQYDFEFWQEYTSFCRGLSERRGISMRTLDKALWQFSKEKQA
jgi:hypothetical protein